VRGEGIRTRERFDIVNKLPFGRKTEVLDMNLEKGRSQFGGRGRGAFDERRESQLDWLGGKTRRINYKGKGRRNKKGATIREG